MIGGALSKRNKEQEKNDQKSLFTFKICLTLGEKLHQNRQNAKKKKKLTAIVEMQIHLIE